MGAGGKTRKCIVEPKTIGAPRRRMYNIERSFSTALMPLQKHRTIHCMLPDATLGSGHVVNLVHAAGADNIAKQGDFHLNLGDAKWKTQNILRVLHFRFATLSFVNNETQAISPPRQLCSRVLQVKTTRASECVTIGSCNNVERLFVSIFAVLSFSIMRPFRTYKHNCMYSLICYTR